MGESDGIPRSVMDTAEHVYEHRDYYDAIGGRVTAGTTREFAVEFEIWQVQEHGGDLVIYSDDWTFNADEVFRPELEDGLSGRWRVFVQTVDVGISGISSASIRFVSEGAGNGRRRTLDHLEVEGLDQ